MRVVSLLLSLRAAAAFIPHMGLHRFQSFRLSSTEVAIEKISVDALVVDEIYEGTVKRVSDFGAFIDFGCKSDGLVHKSQLADSFVATPGDVVKVGQAVKVRVLSIDKEKGQVSLSMKSKGQDAPKPSRAPQQRRVVDYSKYGFLVHTVVISCSIPIRRYETVSETQVFEATVRTVTAYGAFVDFEDGATGLVHISQLAEGRTENAADVAKVVFFLA